MGAGGLVAGGLVARGLFSWVEAYFIQANFEKEEYFYGKEQQIDMAGITRLFNYKEKIPLAAQKHLNASTSPYADFLTAFLIFLFIRAESVQPPPYKFKVLSHPCLHEVLFVSNHIF